MPGLVSARAGRVAPMELADLMRVAQEANAIDIALGIPQQGPPPSAVLAAVGALQDGRHQYAPPAGLPELRRMIAERAGPIRQWDINPDTEVTITCGATEAAMMALLATTDPGDEVVLLEPYFDVFPGMIELAGAVPKPVGLSQPGWRLDIARVEQAITPRTRAILVNSPNNPTGQVLRRDEVLRLVELCVRHDLVCIADEVYEQFLYHDSTHISPSAMASGRNRTIVVGSLSKSLRMTGWRLGYCIAQPELTAVLRSVHERTTVGTSHALQAGAAASLSEELYTGRALQHRRDAVTKRLADLGFDVTPPDGGWFVLAGTETLGFGATELARRLVSEIGVLVAPGTAFFTDRAEGERWIRVTFARDPGATDEALDRIGRFLSR
jgi:aspartate/methionine/tyrosine aminotransferase